MIEIDLDPAPYHYMEFLNAGPRRTGARVELLPFLRGVIKGVPQNWPPIVAIADLQGRSDYGDTGESLVGCQVAEKLDEIHASASLPAPKDCLALLAGDFYTVPNAAKRGGTGDVRLVWRMIGESLGGAWGVAGNHDAFRGTGDDYHSLSQPPPNCLDGKVAEWSGLRIGGVSGSLSISTKESRKKTPEVFARLLEDVLAMEPDILVLHLPPFANESNVGSEMVRDIITQWDYAGLVVCGHVPWKDRVQPIRKATCLNAHEAVVTLLPAV